MNNITLVGNLTADPRSVSEERTLFTIAVNRAGKKGEADFIPCVAWNSTARFVNSYFRKGSSIGVTGSLQSYKNKDEKTAFIVQVRTVEFVGRKNANEDPADKHETPTPAPQPQSQTQSAGSSFDDFTIDANDFDFPF